MCGIVGYIGSRQAPEICTAGLRQLQYRGYDLIGLATVQDGQVHVRTAAGKPEAMDQLLASEPLTGTLGIGHSTWSDRGKASAQDAHPHLSSSHRIAVALSGTVGNHQELREKLTAAGCEFRSQSAGEVVAQLVQTHYEGDLRAAVCRAMEQMQGKFALAAMAADSPDELVAARRFSPLVIGIGQGEQYIATDMHSIRSETDRVYVLGDDEVALLTADGIELTDLQMKPVQREPFVIPQPAAADPKDKGDHRHYMHKEIYEQPDVIRNCLAGRLTSPDLPIQLDGLNMTEQDIRDVRQIIFSACGTANHAGMVGGYLMEKLARISCVFELAAELPSRDPVVLPGSMCVGISQSGETSDTLMALRDLKSKGARVISVLNAEGSTIARESDGVLYIHAGKEIGVASTKAYTLQVLTLAMMALHFAEVRGTADPELIRSLKKELLLTPAVVQQLLSREDEVKAVAQKHYDKPDAFFLGRGVNMASAMEGSLKLKETSYIHSEGYSAGEVRHGPVALLQPSMFVVAIAVQGEVYDMMVANLGGLKGRSAPIIAMATDGDTQVPTAGVDPAADASDSTSQPNDMVWLPPTHEFVSPIAAAIPLQLLAYHMADMKGEGIDQPRHLTKTVMPE
jgi:glucosamine--fructose-6-phosphate aminotransferase (isomerizing)